jgi:hypothetical protein
MRSAELTALFLVAGWLAVLTLTVLLVVRQVAWISIRVEQRGGTRLRGPDIGTFLPDDILPSLNDDVSYLLFVSPTCGPCLKIASELQTQELGGARLLALFAGQDGIADDFASLFPPEVEIIRDPDATAVAEALDVALTPFTLEVESRVITGKAYLRDVSDLLRLIEAREVSDAAEIARNIKEVVGRA